MFFKYFWLKNQLFYILLLFLFAFGSCYFTEHFSFAVENDEETLSDILKMEDEGIRIVNPWNDTVRPLSEEYKTARDEIIGFRTKNNTAPSFEDYYKIIFDHEENLTQYEQSRLWCEILVHVQKPSITKDNLKKILVAKCNSIKTLDCSFHVRNRFGDIEYKFATKGNNSFFLERSGMWGNLDQHEVLSLKDGIFRQVWIMEPLSNANINHAAEDDMQRGYCPQMPLIEAMIPNSSDSRSSVWESLLLLLEQHPHLTVMEKMESYDGNECLILAEPELKIYLDIAKDYSVCCIEHYKNNSSLDKDEPATAYYKSSERKLHNLVDYGNGVWLPTSAEETEYDFDKSVKSHESVEYHVIKINGKIDDKVFVDIIPDQTFVTDNIRNMSYIWGDRASIGSLIKETVKKKRQTIFRNLSLILGLCFIACWGIVEWRKRRLQKGEAE